MQKNIPNTIPQNDGDLTEYENPSAKATPAWYNMHREVVFVNGMLNSPEHHKDAATALSLLQMCKVVGVYNASNIDDGFLKTVSAVAEDLAQCLGDKIQWDTHEVDRGLVKLHTWFQSKVGSQDAAIAYVREWLDRNKAAVTLFDYIMLNKGKPLTIFAHSQGNLITSNALTAVHLLDPGALSQITVNSYASPAVFWPEGFQHHSYAYTVDLVPLIAGVGNSLLFSTSTIGGLSGITSHGFEHYRRDDPTFVVNAFRWGMLRMTTSMDEEGLANALVQMGTNMDRVTKIFDRLEDAHYTDSDDVSLLYIEKIKTKPHLLDTVKKAPKLVAVLTKCLEQGWTTDREKRAIAAIS